MSEIDDRLGALREAPSPQFAARLHARLQRAADEPESRAWHAGRWATGLTVVAATALVAFVPSVRASAQSFLELFRVVNFVAVPVSESRFTELTSKELDIPHLVGERLEVLEEPGPPSAAVSAKQAGDVAGMRVLEPTYLPPGLSLVGITVGKRSRARVTADAGRLQQVLDTLSITDLRVPEALDGKVVDITVPPVVKLSYEQGRLKADLVQVRTPEVKLPAGVSLPQLGEIGLRILGLPATEARQFAQTIDWSSSLIVAIPPMATRYKQIEVSGRRGVLIQREEPVRGVDGQPTGRTRTATVLLWSDGERVLGLEGTIFAQELQLMADSLR